MIMDKYSRCLIFVVMFVECFATGKCWDTYIDSLISQTIDQGGDAQCDKACIIGLENGEPFTSSSHPNALVLEGTEGANIAQCFNSNTYTCFQENGIIIGGVTYQLISEEDEIYILGKKKNKGAVALHASNTAIVIGHAKEDGALDTVNEAVTTITEYLQSVGM